MPAMKAVLVHVSLIIYVMVSRIVSTMGHNGLKQVYNQQTMLFAYKWGIMR